MAEETATNSTTNNTSGGDVTEKDNTMMYIIIAAVAGLLLCVVLYCFCKGKGDDKEGGNAENRTLFKKEVKSKNAHKRHTKEQLVPSFEVTKETV